MTMKTLYIAVLPAEVKVSESPLSRNGANKYLSVNVITSGAGTGIGRVEVDYFYGSNTSDKISIQFNQANPSNLMTCDGDTLLNKLKLLYISLSQDEVSALVGESTLPGSTYFEKYLSTFTVAYGMTLANYFLMNNDHDTIGQPFGPIEPMFPEIDMTLENLLTRSLCSYVRYFQDAMGLVSGDYIGKFAMKYNKLFWDNWGNCFPVGDEHNESDAIHKSMMGLTKHNNERFSDFYDSIDSVNNALASQEKKLYCQGDKILSRMNEQRCCFDKAVKDAMEARSQRKEEIYKTIDCKVKSFNCLVESEKTSLREYVDGVMSCLDSKMTEAMEAIEDCKMQQEEQLQDLKEQILGMLDDKLNDKVSQLNDTCSSLAEDTASQCQKVVHKMEEHADVCHKRLDREVELAKQDVSMKSCEAVSDIDKLLVSHCSAVNRELEKAVCSIRSEHKKSQDLTSAKQTKIDTTCDKYLKQLECLREDHSNTLIALRDGIANEASLKSKELTRQVRKEISSVIKDRDLLVREVSNEASCRVLDSTKKRISSHIGRELECIAPTIRERVSDALEVQVGKRRIEDYLSQGKDRNVLLKELMAEIHLLKVEVMQLKHKK